MRNNIDQHVYAVEDYLLVMIMLPSFYNVTNQPYQVLTLPHIETLGQGGPKTLTVPRDRTYGQLVSGLKYHISIHIHIWISYRGGS